jgi:hypothetical protein
MKHENMNTIKEITNNGLTTRNYLNKYRHLDVACLYCVKMYRYFSNSKLYIISNNTLCCPVCHIDALVPITPGSNMYKMEGDERKEQMIMLHNHLFVHKINDDSEYCDYNYEETKTDPLLK